jgi:Rod binding domain-containing protein
MNIASIATLRLNAALENTTGKSPGAKSQPSFQDVLSTATHDDGTKVKKAAQQFEGLILGQMLKSVHESNDDGVLGGGDDPSASTAMEMAYENIAQTMAANGGIGLAKFVEKGFAAKPKSI